MPENVRIIVYEKSVANQPLKTRGRQFDDFVVASGTISCH